MDRQYLRGCGAPCPALARLGTPIKDLFLLPRPPSIKEKPSRLSRNGMDIGLVNVAVDQHLDMNAGIISGMKSGQS